MPGVGGFSFEDADQVTAGLPAAAPRDIGFGGGVQAGFDAARSGADWGANQATYEGRILAPIKAEADQMGFQNQPIAGGGRGTRLSIWQAEDAQIDQLLSFINQQRRKNPKLLSQYSGLLTRADVGREAIRLRKIDLDDANERLGRTSGAGQIGGFVGQVGAAGLDPLSYIPVGGAGIGVSVARQILGVAAKEAAANAAITAISEPLVQRDAARLGIDRSVGDAITEIGAAAVFGGVLGGGAEALGIGAKRALDRRSAARAAASGTGEERATIEAVEAGIGSDNLTPDERAAINVLRRDVEVREASPYTATPEGDAAFKANLDQASEMLRLAYTGSRAERAEAMAALDANVSRATPAVSQRVDPAVLADFKASIRRAESPSDTAKNPNSSAQGRYQFIDDTFIYYYRKRYGDTHVKRSDILAKKNDGALQDILMDDLMADNVRALVRSNVPVTKTSMYVLHFAGEGGGVNLLRAAPDAPIEDVLGAGVVKANRFLRGKNAGEAIAELGRRVGAKGDDVAVAARAADVPDEVDIATLGEAPPPVLRGDDDLGFDPADYLDSLRDYVDNRRGSLSPDALGEALKLPPEQAQAVAFKLLEEGGTSGLVYQRPRFVDQKDAQGRVIKGDDGKPVQVLRDGVIKRAPRQLSAPREEDVLSFIARSGGIADDGADDIGGFFGKKRQKLIPGIGPLIRREGRSVDEVGEALFEAGYFVGDERPSTADVLDLIDRSARGERIYRPDEQAKAEPADASRADTNRWRATAAMRKNNDIAIAEFARWDHEFSGNDMDRMMDLMADGMDSADASIMVIRDRYAALLDEASLISDSPDYEIDYDASGQPYGEQFPPDSGFGGDDARRGDTSGDASAGREGDGNARQDRSGAERLSDGTKEQFAENANYATFNPTNDPRLDGFDDPNGAGADLVVDSLEHDLRMLIDELSANDDLSTLSFDVDGDGEVRNLADILADFDDDAALLTAARNCMVAVRVAV